MHRRFIIAVLIVSLIILPVKGSLQMAFTYITDTVSVNMIKPETDTLAVNPDEDSDKTDIESISSPLPEKQTNETVSQATPVAISPEHHETETSYTPEPNPAQSTETPATNDGAHTDDTVIADSFPLPVMDSYWEYVIFKNEVNAIVKEAEQASGIDTKYGVFVMDLTNYFIFGINESLTRIDPYDNMKEGYFNSASVVKLFQGYILCDMMRRGELSEDEVYYDQVTGRRFRLLKMIKIMISYSDNNYSNAALRLIGNTKSNEVLDRLGIHDSRIYGEMSGAIGYSAENNLKRYGTIKRCARITPRDTGLILYNVYINRETDIYMQTLNQALKANIYNSRIPAGVAKVNQDYEIAHKTGTNSALGVYNDAGIIYCKRPFILVVFTQSVTAGKGEKFIQILAEKLTRYFDSKASTEADAPQSISSDSQPG